MFNKLQAWIKRRYYDTVNSIAFYPAFIALVFLGVAYGSITLDFSELGKSLKSTFSWLTLRDADTARVIISTILAGILSLTVFSFSMVMIVLNQAASQMSNRILDKLIGNRFQQMILGVYIGTIVFALFLLSTIRDIESHLYIPVLSTYLLIIFAVFDIFLFIYFLHYITQSVKYEVIINRIYDDTKISMDAECTYDQESTTSLIVESNFTILSPKSGIFEGFESEILLKLCHEHDFSLSFLHARSTFVFKNQPVVIISEELAKEVQIKISESFIYHKEERIENNFFYGFKQLVEIALKALSPGLNDPGTAIVSMRSLFVLMAKRSQAHPELVFEDESGQSRVVIKEQTFEELFERTVMPIWDYGKEDRLLIREMFQLLTQLNNMTDSVSVKKLLKAVEKKIKSLNEDEISA
jgi:uncharacterized membrane protein